MRGLFAGAIAFATLVGLAAGLVLGLVAATEVALDDRWTEVVQAHGRLQLGAWAVPFVVALAFEFLPRLNQRPWLAPAPRLATLALLFAGAIAEAAALVWSIEWLLLVGALSTGGGALLFALLVVHLRDRGPRFTDPQVYFFPAAAVWLVVAAVVVVAAQLREESLPIPQQDSRLVVELIIRGFLLNAVIAVVLRAFTEHFDLPAVSKSGRAVLLVGLSVGTLCWMLGSGGVGLPDVEWLRRLGDLILALQIGMATWWLGILSSRTAWHGDERYRPLLPLSWLGLVAYGGLLALVAATTDLTTVGVYDEGAVRHVFLTGFLAPFVFAMAHVVLTHFGGGSAPAEGLLSLSVVLALVAWPFRVLPMVWVERPGVEAQIAMGVGGGLAMVAFALALAAFVKATVRLSSNPDS